MLASNILRQRRPSNRYARAKSSGAGRPFQSEDYNSVERPRSPAQVVRLGNAAQPPGAERSKVIGTPVEDRCSVSRAGLASAARVHGQSRPELAGLARQVDHRGARRPRHGCIAGLLLLLAAVTTAGAAFGLLYVALR